MLKYTLPALSANANLKLNTLQAKVNTFTTRKEQYDEAKKLFANKTNATWVEIKKVLADFAPKGKACYYCERDRHRDVEHISPKLHYPERCFDWENYIYACTICNQDMKNDTFAVFDAGGNVVEFNRTYDIALPLPIGPAVLIDIRHEDPLNFLILNLETGRFAARGNAISKKRGEFTRGLFDLNESSLADIRIAAFEMYCMYLKKFKSAIDEGDAVKANRAFDEIMKLNHPTVLVEMRRQSGLIPELMDLFDGVPEKIGKRPI
ncbi:hypothetical protein [Pseudoduganella lutea]|uniref:TIGR02646 family protein n=1 Tax=Pseudoduganella lutea TaxID=321985 RepID=A0A4P6L069_9BURK|nr:hypothetical protein [Pseudoduganella lutea]QBE64919.1 hypothetical protein EWM63_19565 [Pseudoduganella lutea]